VKIFGAAVIFTICLLNLQLSFNENSSSGFSLGIISKSAIAQGEAGCVDVFSVRCPSRWGDCCYVSSQAFSCVQRIC
jgi:hypothetical protein